MKELVGKLYIPNVIFKCSYNKCNICPAEHNMQRMVMSIKIRVRRKIKSCIIFSMIVE